MRRLDFHWDWFGLAVVLALLLHALVIPRLFSSLTERREAPVEVAYLNEEEPSAARLEEPDPQAPEMKLEADKEPPRARTPIERKLEERRLAKQKKEQDKLEKLEKKPPEIAKAEPPKPPPPPTPPPPPPQPMPPPPKHQKMVDQDAFKDEADNAEAKYLSQKNHRATEDKVTRNTNLVRNQAGEHESPSAPSDNKDPQSGMPDRKIAETQKRAGEEHKIVRSPRQAGDEGSSQASKPGKLSMRGLVPHSAEPHPTEKAREGLELNDPEKGPLPMARRGDEGERAGSRAKGARGPNLTLGPLDYDKIVGESVAAAERQKAARAEVSRAPGHWEKQQKKLAMMRSSLENFTLDAHVGNEAELGTRAHPFAAYIATMHRSIHKLFAFDFLASLDGKGTFDPYSDMTLWTMVGITLSSEGVVLKVTINHPSGYAPFDAAALDSVMSSSPFPPPPESIKSPDGRVYLDWTFHRDGQACGTEGVYPHILEHAGEKHAAGPSPPTM